MITLLLGKSLLERYRIEIQVKRYPREAKRALWSEFSKEPLSRAANHMTLAVGCAKRVTDRSSEYRCQEISFRFYWGCCFGLVLGQKLVGRIAHSLCLTPVNYDYLWEVKKGSSLN